MPSSISPEMKEPQFKHTASFSAARRLLLCKPVIREQLLLLDYSKASSAVQTQTLSQTRAFFVNFTAEAPGEQTNMRMINMHAIFSVLVTSVCLFFFLLNVLSSSPHVCRPLAVSMCEFVLLTNKLRDEGGALFVTVDCHFRLCFCCLFFSSDSDRSPHLLVLTSASMIYPRPLFLCRFSHIGLPQ